ncbi:MAG: hypothetical protein JO247_09495 [Chloroflexi bacterium]|nr:hypothetical protein [Chloroflexota bacterium]
MPLAHKPQPDIASAGPLYEDAYIAYPQNPFKAVAEPPGAGSDVVAFVQQNAGPPTPFDQNPAWKEVNRQLNANVKFINPVIADAPSKLAALMAGNDLPDMISLFGGVNAAPNVPQFLDAKAADLTPYLAGDGIKAYPYLAATPTFAWKNCGCVVNGRLLMVAIERPAPGNVLLKNATLWEQAVGRDYVPKNADDLRRVLQQLNQPQAGRWALESYQGAAFDMAYWSERFGAPNNWALDAAGKLLKNWETPEYKEAVGYARDLFAAGLYHPNSLTNNIKSTQSDLSSQKFAVWPTTFGNVWSSSWRDASQQKSPFDLLLVKPFPAHDGDKVVTHLGTGFIAGTALKQASPERVKELLRILDFLAAPFGSQEDLLLTSGLRDVDYTLDDKGNPTLTQRGTPDAYNVPWKNIAQHPQVIYQPDIPNFAQTFSDAEKALIPTGVADPTLGFVSATNSAKGFVLAQAMTAGLTDIIAGRRPIADLDQLVSDWRTNGGEQIRTEFLQAISSAK